MIYSVPIPCQFVENPAPWPRLADEVEAAVEKIWQEKKAISPSLFNGEIFAMEKASAEQMTVRLAEYRLFVAQSGRHELYPQIRVDTLAVVGVIRAGEGIVWGRRSPASTQYPGAWELVPSGGVDRQSRTDGGLDLQRQVMGELGEEIGLKAEHVDKMRAVCFLHDTNPHLYILCHEIESRLDFNEIKKRHETAPHQEHSELTLVPFDKLEAFIANEGRELADFSTLVLRSCGLL